VAERQIALPPNKGRQRAMLNRRIRNDLTGLVARIAVARNEIRDTISKSVKTIAESRELMAEVDAVVARDKISGAP
jgi:hypothetical protein